MNKWICPKTQECVNPYKAICKAKREHDKVFGCSVGDKTSCPSCVPVPSKPKEVSIEAKLDYFISENSSKAKDILTYLSAHGFGDIEQTRKKGAKEERERIIKYLLDSKIISADGEYFKALKQEGE